MKKINLIGLSFIFLLICALGVLADTATLRTPAASATQAGTAAKLNISVSQPNSNYTGCTAWATNTNVNITRVTIKANITPDGGGGMSINASFNITYNTGMLQDSTSWVINGACNSTNDTVVTASNSGITIDNTVPTTPTESSPSSTIVITSSGTQTFTSTVGDSTTNGCTYTIARGGAISGGDYYSGTGTYSTTSCSFDKAFSTSIDNGLWYVYWTATDGTNTTTSAVSKYNIGIPGSGGGGALIAQQAVSQVATTTTSTGENVFTRMWNAIIEFFTKIFS